MQKPNLPINMAENRTVIKVLQGASYVVPETQTGASPAGISSGLSPSTILDSRRATVGGQIVTSFTDTAGNVVTDVAWPLLPGDTVACSAVAAGKITVTVTSLGGTVKTLPLLTATAVGGVILVWG